MSARREDEPAPGFVAYRHQEAIPFKQSHLIQRLIGDMNFIHIPAVTAGLDDADHFLGLNATPGYVIASIPVFRTVAAAARHYIANGMDPTRMKISSLMFEFAAPVSFQGQINELVGNPSTPNISFISNIQLSDSQCTGYHDAIVTSGLSGQQTKNIFLHKDIDNPADSHAVVAVTLDDLASRPAGATEHCLPNALETPLGHDYSTFFQAVYQLSTTKEDLYKPRVIAAAYSALAPWYLAGMSAKIISQYLSDPSQAGPFSEKFSELAERLGFDRTLVENLWINLQKRIAADSLSRQQYLELLSQLGAVPDIIVPKKAFPMYTKIQYSGLSGNDNIAFGGPTTLDLTELSLGKRECTALFTAFVGDSYAYQFQSSFTLVPTKIAPRIFREN